MRIWISATCLSTVPPPMSDWPRQFIQAFSVLNRGFRRWYPAPASPQGAAQRPLRIDRIVTGQIAPALVHCPGSCCLQQRRGFRAWHSAWREFTAWASGGQSPRGIYGLSFTPRPCRGSTCLLWLRGMLAGIHFRLPPSALIPVLR